MENDEDNNNNQVKAIVNIVLDSSSMPLFAQTFSGPRTILREDHPALVCCDLLCSGNRDGEEEISASRLPARDPWLASRGACTLKSPGHLGAASSTAGVDCTMEPPRAPRGVYFTVSRLGR